MIKIVNNFINGSEQKQKTEIKPEKKKLRLPSQYIGTILQKDIPENSTNFHPQQLNSSSKSNNIDSKSQSGISRVDLQKTKSQQYPNSSFVNFSNINSKLPKNTSENFTNSQKEPQNKTRKEIIENSANFQPQQLNQPFKPNNIGQKNTSKNSKSSQNNTRKEIIENPKNNSKTNNSHMAFNEIVTTLPKKDNSKQKKPQISEIPKIEDSQKGNLQTKNEIIENNLENENNQILDSSAGQKFKESPQMDEKIIANFYDFYIASGISNMTLEDSIKSQKETQENRIIEVSDQDSNDQDSNDQDSNDQDSNDQDANNQDLEFLKSEVEKLECEIRIIKASDQDSNDQDANNQNLKFLENEVARLGWEIIKSSFKESKTTKKLQNNTYEKSTNFQPQQLNQSFKLNNINSTPQENRIIKASDQDANNQDLEFSESEVARLGWEIIKSSFKESKTTKKTES